MTPRVQIASCRVSEAISMAGKEVAELDFGNVLYYPVADNANAICQRVAQRLARNNTMAVPVITDQICDIKYLREGKVVTKKLRRWLRDQIESEPHDKEYFVGRSGMVDAILEQFFVHYVDMEDFVKTATGSRICDLYLQEVGGHSCMTGYVDEDGEYDDCESDTPLTIMYSENQDVVSLLYMKSGFGSARRLLWETNEGVTYADRIYATSTSAREILMKYVKEQGWMDRKYCSERLSVDVHSSEGIWPYMDSFVFAKATGIDYGCVTSATLCTEPDNTKHEALLDSQSGEWGGSIPRDCQGNCGEIAYDEYCIYYHDGRYKTSLRLCDDCLEDMISDGASVECEMITLANEEEEQCTK